MYSTVACPLAFILINVVYFLKKKGTGNYLLIPCAYIIREVIEMSSIESDRRGNLPFQKHFPLNSTTFLVEFP